MSAQSKLQELLAKRRASNVKSNQQNSTTPEVAATHTTHTADIAVASAEQPTVEQPSNTIIASTTGQAASVQLPMAAEPKPSVAAQSTHPLALKLAELEEAQDKKLPNRPYILKEIHDALAKDYELVTQLTDEEIGLIVSNLREHTGVTITPKPKKSQRKRSQPVDLAMLD